MGEKPKKFRTNMGIPNPKCSLARGNYFFPDEVVNGGYCFLKTFATTIAPPKNRTGSLVEKIQLSAN
ncbi:MULTISPECIES: hypothetical protein [Chryseobacterium]|uniref:hypothetical protein n=1 Tax=Chryseobacterium sp. R2A-55 TaxID=2744445 RepID=UPI001F1C6C2E|nr:hypothetical protein [Chryseobacterium sp. R2A-55]